MEEYGVLRDREEIPAAGEEGERRIRKGEEEVRGKKREKRERVEEERRTRDR